MFPLFYCECSLVTYTFINYSFSGPSQSQLDHFADRNNNQITLHYNATTGLLTSVSDNFSRSFSFTANPATKLITSVSDTSSTVARTVSYGYDANSRLQIVTDTRGYSTQYGYDTNGLLNQRYDQNNHLVMQNYYDQNQRVVTQTTFSGPNPATDAQTFYFDYTSRPGSTIVTNSRGYATIYQIDPNTAQPIEIIDALGNLRAVVRDGNDNATIITDVNRRVSYVDYSSVGRPTGVRTNVSANGVVQTITASVQYDATTNNPLFYTDVRGNTTSYGYDPQGNITLISDPLSQTTKYDYDPGVPGRITKITALNGATTTFSYNTPWGLPDALTQTYSTLVTTTGTNLTARSYRTDYKYNPQGWLIWQSDPYDTAYGPNTNSPGKSYGYDGSGRMVTTTNQIGQTASYNYDRVGNLITSTNFLGQQTAYDYDWQNRLTTTRQFWNNGTKTNRTSNVYDSVGNMIARTDPNLVTTYYSYDALNRQTSMTLGLQSGGVIKSLNEYDGSGNLVTLTNTNSTNGGSGDQVTRYQYDELNRLVTTTLSYGYQQVNIYDVAGNVIETRQSKDTATGATNWTAASQVITSGTTYDPLNRPLASVVNAWSPQAGDHLLFTRYSYNDPLNLRTTADPYGIKTTTQTDGGSRTISTTVTRATGEVEPTNYTYYDPNGLAVRNVDPLGNWTETGYDGLHRIIRSTSYTSTANSGQALTTQTFYIDTSRPQVTTIGPAPDYERHDSFLDELGRLVTSTVYTESLVPYPTLPKGPLSTVFTYDGRGNRISLLDPNLHTTLYGYENTGWLKVVTQTVNSQPISSTYDYDLMGNRIRQTDGAGRVITDTFDQLNRLTDESDAGSNVWHTYFDGLGRTRMSQDANGKITNYAYDNASRVLSMITANTITTTFLYNDGGQVLNMTDQIAAGQSTNTAYNYDGLNRLLSVTNPQGLVKYDYDSLGRRTSLQFGVDQNNLKQVTYSYDGLSRPVNITNWLTQTLNYQYDGARLKKVNYPNGVTASYNFDGANRLLSLSHASPVSGTVFSVNYSLDALGNRTAATENLNGVNRQLNYRYDEMSRLISETQQIGTAQPTGSTYQYDGASNRLQMLTTLPSNIKGSSGSMVLITTYGYNNTNQLITRSESGSATPFNSNNYAYSYDRSGNLITETNTVSGGELTGYTYDPRNRLVGWQKQAKGQTLATASFTYDGANTRTSLTYGSKTTTYLQDTQAGEPVVLQEMVSGQQSPNRFMYDLDSTSPLYQQDANGTSLWYHQDGLGSVRALTLQSGVITGTFAYSAFGLNAPTGDSSVVGAGSKVANTHLFAGEQLDPTGLYYNRARYYNSSLGRFISRDTYNGDVSTLTSQNHFIYSDNNPVDNVDPSGFVSINTVNNPNGYAEQHIIASWYQRTFLADAPEDRRLDGAGDKKGKKKIGVGFGKVDIADKTNGLIYEVKHDEENAQEGQEEASYYIEVLHDTQLWGKKKWQGRPGQSWQLGDKVSGDWQDIGVWPEEPEKSQGYRLWIRSPYDGVIIYKGVPKNTKKPNSMAKQKTLFSIIIIIIIIVVTKNPVPVPIPGITGTDRDNPCFLY